MGSNNKLTLTCSDFRPCRRNALVGFARIEIAEWALEIGDIAIHAKNDRFWCQLPAKAQIRDGALVKDAAGKIQYFPVMAFTRRAWAEAFCARVCVLDIDGVEGEATLRRLEAEHGQLPQTVEVITGGGGRHLYFKWPSDGTEIRNAQCLDEYPGLDWRGPGGFVVCPPSIHPSGRIYCWSVDSADAFPEAPPWLLEIVTGRARVREPPPVMPPEAWRAFFDNTYEGSRRGHAIARLAGIFLRIRRPLACSLCLPALQHALLCPHSCPGRSPTHRRRHRPARSVSALGWPHERLRHRDARHTAHEAREQEVAALEAVGTEEAAAATVQARQAALAIAERALDDTVVRAWHDGRVVGLTVLSGEMVVPSQALFTLINTEEWFAVANFRETDLRAIAVGDCGIERQAAPHASQRAPVEDAAGMMKQQR